MSDIESEVSASLRGLAESWLKRPLITTELAQLEQFQRDWGNAAASGGTSQGGASQAAPVPGDPAAQVRQQAAQAVSEAKQRSESAIRDVLKKLQGTAAQAAARVRELWAAGADSVVLRPFGQDPIGQASATIGELR